MSGGVAVVDGGPAGLSDRLPRLRSGLTSLGDNVARWNGRLTRLSDDLT
ncbi:hypothetical protein Aph02nite_39510 [Actinoplanes philippinensis]|nr:hypothetical protein Aph02nite_39510 [Actinoplanes philippinensis]